IYDAFSRPKQVLSDDAPPVHLNYRRCRAVDSLRAQVGALHRLVRSIERLNLERLNLERLNLERLNHWPRPLKVFRGCRSNLVNQPIVITVSIYGSQYCSRVCFT
ncbi:hypothetical protein, partial [Moorena sp. SIO4G3]|uniref:hypothetical protein n=1 Tax=Moorena sp. SIO4G3 TaxID=2607821 RepID=UPI0025F98387